MSELNETSILHALKDAAIEITELNARVAVLEKQLAKAWDIIIQSYHLEPEETGK